MPRRILALWLASLTTDRLIARAGPGEGLRERLLVTIAGVRGRQVLAAVGGAAAAAGLAPGMTLADARALEPGLVALPEDPAADADALLCLCAWCDRFTPWVAAHGPDGILLDITGSAHLFGDEAGLVRRLAAGLAGLGLGARLAVADTAAAAAALARVGPAFRHGAPPERLAAALAPAGGSPQAVAGLPVAGLGLDAALTGSLERLGLKRIGDLMPLPRTSLAARFGPGLIARLDEVLGMTDGPISPRLPVPPHLARLAFAEPIGRTEDVSLAVEHLAASLARTLEAAGKGARRLELRLYRVDGGTLDRRVGTSRATRDPAHICRLFALTLDGIDAGFGIEVMMLAAAAVEPLAPEQAVLGPTVAEDAAGLARLVDRLEGRLGAGAVRRAVPQQSHLPERAVRAAPPFAPLPDALWPAGPPRPVRLLPRPQPVEAMAPVPDDPPLTFRRGRTVHRIARADGPERIAPEWWRAGGETRDYYRVEDTAGRRFWLSRAGLYDPQVPPRWFLHGVFG